MQSFIIVAKEKTKRETYVKEYATKHTIDIFDITIIEKDPDAKTATQSIGIEIIKQLQKKIFLKPIKSSSKLIIIEDAQLLTPEAQNALLKVLEEPPLHTYIMLGSQTQEVLLPTILSRCQIIILEEETQKLSEQTTQELLQFIENLPELTLSQRLKQAERLAKDKEKAVVWVENLILVLRTRLLENYSQEARDIEDPRMGTFDTSDTRDTFKKLQALHTLLKTTNINPRFAIEHTLLSL